MALLCWKPFGNTGSLDVPFLLSPSSGLSGRRVVLLVRLRRGLRRGHLRPLPPGDPPGGQRGPRLPADGGEAPVSRAPLLQGTPAPGQRRRAGRDGHPAAWEVRQEAEPERIRRQVQPQVLQEEGGPVPVSGERRSLSKRVSVSKCLIFFLSLSLSLRYCVVFTVEKATKSCQRNKDTSALSRGRSQLKKKKKKRRDVFYGKVNSTFSFIRVRTYNLRQHDLRDVRLQGQAQPRVRPPLHWTRRGREEDEVRIHVEHFVNLFKSGVFHC